MSARTTCVSIMENYRCIARSPACKSAARSGRAARGVRGRSKITRSVLSGNSVRCSQSMARICRLMRLRSVARFDTFVLTTTVKRCPNVLARHFSVMVFPWYAARDLVTAMISRDRVSRLRRGNMLRRSNVRVLCCVVVQ